MKITEYDVTTSVVNLLNTNNWEILSVNTPFSGKSIWIKPIDGYRGKGTLIPDIIARKRNNYFIIEAYNKFKKSDIAKLNKYTTNLYFESIKQLFNEDKNIKIIKGMAYANTLIKYNYPKDLIVFIVEDSNNIKIYCNKVTINTNESNDYFNFPLENF